MTSIDTPNYGTLSDVAAILKCDRRHVERAVESGILDLAAYRLPSFTTDPTTGQVTARWGKGSAIRLNVLSAVQLMLKSASAPDRAVPLNRHL
jgi:hypothetical protein